MPDNIATPESPELAVNEIFSAQEATPEIDTPTPDAPASTEPGEPTETPVAEPAEESAAVTLSADEARFFSEHGSAFMEWLSSRGMAPAQQAADPNTNPAANPEAPPAQAQPTEFADWEPMTEEEASLIGLDGDSLEAFTARERYQATAVVKQFAKEFMPEIRQLYNEAALRSEVVTLTIHALTERPDLEAITPQVRNEIARARVANPDASPNKVMKMAIDAASLHLAGFQFFQRSRGVKDANPSTPNPTRPVATQTKGGTSAPTNHQPQNAREMLDEIAKLSSGR